MADNIFYSLVAGFVGGIFLHSFVKIGAAFSWFFVLLGAIFFILPFLKGVPHSDEGRDSNPPPRGFGTSFKKGGMILCAAFLLAAGLGMLRYDLAERERHQTGLDRQADKAVMLEGVIADEPDVREAVTRLILKTEHTKVLLTVSHEPQFLYGDKVKVEGKLERPKNFEDEKTLREVDYISHLGKDGIYYEMFRPKVALIAHGEGNWLVEQLFAFKNAFIENINAALPQPHAALLGGLVVGAKQSLGKKLLDDFRLVCVIHIVVLSGYNITIIARFIEWLLDRLKKNLRLILASVGIVLFAVMVGAS